MKTAIVYTSMHHGNTKKLVDAISNKYEVTLINGKNEKDFDLSEYDLIGFASGIAYSNFYPEMQKIIENKLPECKDVFFIYTCGSKHSNYTDYVKKIAKNKYCKVLGEYGCLGFDTYGPFRLIGGISKGHPTDGEVLDAVKFYEKIVTNKIYPSR